MKNFASHISTKFGYILFGFAFGVLVVGSLQFVLAWTGPTQAPPNGNAPAPLNVSAAAQWKAGSLSLGTGAPARNDLGWPSALEINGQAKAARYYDDDPNYYVDANSTSRLNYGVFDNLHAYGSVQSQNFVDANHNGYYLDPNNGSRLNYGLFDNVDAYGNIGANDVYLRSIGQWTSQLGSFGGMYEECHTPYRTCPVSCWQANPKTGSCSCPAGYYPMMSGMLFHYSEWDGRAMICIR